MLRASYIDRVRRAVFKTIVRSLTALGAYGLLSRIATLFVSERRAGRTIPYSSKTGQKNRATLLVLDWQRFRGDLDILSDAGDLRFLCISWRFLDYLLATFVGDPVDAETAADIPQLSPREAFAGAVDGSEIDSARAQYRKFLARFLPMLFERIGVDVVMNSDYRYRREMDWIRVASQLNYPHICYFREAMFIVPAVFEKALKRYRIMAPFRGDLIAVQNDATKRLFIEAGMGKPNRIIVRGCPRMDELLRKLSRAVARPGRRQIAFFSWPHHVPLRDGTRFELFPTACEVVRALAQMAYEDPTLNVVLKIKDQHMKGELKGQVIIFAEIIRDVYGEDVARANIRFETERMAAQNLILQSDVVCAMQSTVVMEAAIASKPVILPHFTDLVARPSSDEALMYCKHRHLFDVPRNCDEVKVLVLHRLANPVIPADIEAQRRALFETYVSPLDGSSTERSLAILRELADRGRQQRSCATTLDVVRAV